MKLKDFLDGWKSVIPVLIGTQYGDGYLYWFDGNDGCYHGDVYFLARNVKSILLMSGTVQNRVFDGVSVIIEGYENGKIFFD